MTAEPGCAPVPLPKCQRAGLAGVGGDDLRTLHSIIVLAEVIVFAEHGYA